MHNVTRLKYIIACMLVLLMPAHLLRAGEINVSAGVSESEVYGGEDVYYQVIVEGSEADSEPDVSAVSQFKLRSLGPPGKSSQTYMQYINGRQSVVTHETYTYQYALTAPLKAGTYTIPSVTVKVKGKEYKTRPVTFRVLQPRTSDNYPLVITPEKTEVYQGEPIRVSLDWYLGGQAQSPVRLRFDPQGSGFRLVDLVDYKVTRADLNNRRYVTLDFNGDEVYARMQQGRYQGMVMTRVTLEVYVIAERTGTLALGPALVSFEVPRRQPRRSIFDSPFDTVRTDRYISRADPVNINVKPLPAAGRPADWNGLVGKYDIECFAKPREVNVGDPITFMIRITGTQPLSRVEPPDISKNPDFTAAFRISDDEPSVSVDENAKTIVQTIRARQADVREIPPLELPYFDTESGSYRVARSKAVPLTVHPTKEITAADALGNGKGRLSDLQANDAGIEANVESEIALRDMKTGPLQWLTEPLWLIIIIIPPLSFFLAATVVSVRRKLNADPAARRRRKAAKRARRRLHHAGRASDLKHAAGIISEALRGYLADRFNLAEAGLTTQDCEKTLAEHNLPVEEYINVMKDCDRVLFAGSTISGDTSELRSRAATAIDRLEKNNGGNES